MLASLSSSSSEGTVAVSLEVENDGEARFLLGALCDALSAEQSLAALRFVASEVVGQASVRILMQARREWTAKMKMADAAPRRAARLAEKQRNKEAEAKGKSTRRGRASALPKRAKKKKKQREEDELPSVTLEELNAEHDDEETMPDKALLLEALAAAEQGLEWRWLMGSYLDEQVRQEAEHWSEADVAQQLEDARAQLEGLDSHALNDASDPLVTLARCRRAKGLMCLGVRTLRSLVGCSSGKKRALVLELAARPRFEVPRILPLPEASLDRARMMLCRLQDACTEATDAARLSSFARDAHVAWAWDWLGRSNGEAVDTLNEWCGTTHTIGEWLKRRRRGELLLQMPALAYQTVMPLDESRMTAHEVLELARSDGEVHSVNERLLSKYAAVLGQPMPSAIPVSRAEDIPLLHRHGYEVLPIAVHVDEGIVAQLEQTSGFQPIFNGNNDGRRLELDVNQICGEAFAELKQRIMDVVARRHPGHEVRGMVALRSEVGCAEQPAHTDYLQEGPSSGWYDWDTDSVPLSCIVALQDGTELNVWPEAIRFNWTRPYNRERLVVLAPTWPRSNQCRKRQRLRRRPAVDTPARPACRCRIPHQ